MRVSRIRMLVLVGFVAIWSATSSLGQAGGVGTAPQVISNGPMGGEDHPLRISAGVMAGLLQHKVDPEYPQDAREAKVSGTVVLLAKVDKTGNVVDLKVISGAEKLRDSALTAVRQWTYKPYLLNGQAVFVQGTVTVNFLLQP